MIEWILSSTAVILIVIALLGLLKGKIRPILQYSLWAVVLVRLLIPFNFFETGISVQNLHQTALEIPQIRQTVDSLERYEQAYDTAREWFTNMDYLESVDSAHEEAEKALYADFYLSGVESASPEDDAARHQQAREQAENIHTLSIFLSVLWYLWIAGIILVGAVLIVSNLRFHAILLSNRKTLDRQDWPLWVYVTDLVTTPCLFGWHPVIYLTEEAASDPKLRDHVIAHELTHYCHKDHIWSILRCVCLAVHWYNPLVWLAASLSKRDAELACDEATIRALGERERAAYGRTLVDMTCEGYDPSDLLLAATTMLGSKKTLLERIELIAAKPKNAIITLSACFLVMALAVGCTFTGAKPGPTEPDYSGANWPVVQKDGYFPVFTDEEIAAAEAAAWDLIEEDAEWVRYDPLMTSWRQPEQIFYQSDEEYVHAMQNYIIMTYCVDTGSHSGFQSRYEYYVFKLTRDNQDSPWRMPVGVETAYFSSYGSRNIMSPQELQRFSMVGDVVAGYKNGMDGVELYVRTEKGLAIVFLDSSFFIPGGRELLPSEMEAFEELFANSADMDNWYNFALKSHYESPADVDLLNMFYDAPRMEVTQAEIERIENPHNVVHKYPVSMMNKALDQVFGITLEDANLVGTERMTYLADYDSYYHVHGNQIITKYNFELGVQKEDGTIKLYYRPTENYTRLEYPHSATACVTLEPQPDGTYRIVSNLPVNWQIEPDARAWES